MHCHMLYGPFTLPCYAVIRQCKAILSIYTVIIYFLYTLLSYIACRQILLCTYCHQKKNHVILSLDTVIHALSLDTVTDIPSQTLTVWILSFEAVLTHSVAYTYAKSYPKVCCVVLSQSVTNTRRTSVIVGIFFFREINVRTGVQIGSLFGSINLVP